MRITKEDLERVKKELEEAKKNRVDAKRITFLQATVNRYSKLLNK